VQQLAGDLKAPPEQLPERVAATLDRLRSAEKELDHLRAAAVLASAGTLAEGAEMIGATRVVTAAAPAGVGAGELRSLALDVRGRLPQSEAALVVLAAPGDKGVSFVAAVNDAGRSAELSANDVVHAFAPVLGARGGGKADLAQGAGGDAGKLSEAFAAVRRYVVERGTG
jgi:alanyl-tRNA synthetase